MNILDYFDLDTLLFRALAFVLLITLHDALLAWLAKRIGNAAPAEQGRLSLNPGRHLDPLGTLMVLFGPYGWSRPMPANQAAEGEQLNPSAKGESDKPSAGADESDKRWRKAAVYAIGPLFYAVMAFFSSWWFLALPETGGGWLTLLGSSILQYVSITATLLAVINLIPLYPMDAWKFVQTAVTEQTRVKLAAKEKWLLIFWVTLMALPAGRKVMEAVYQTVHSWMTSVLPI